MKKHTEWKEYTEGKQRFRIRAEYGFTHFKGQAPYWSVTGTTERLERGRWRDNSGGAFGAETLAPYFPEVAKLCKWHLTAFPGVPMHYLANGLYWWEIAAGIKPNTAYGPNPVEAFKSTVCFGTVEGDEMPSLGATYQEVKEWLLSRWSSLAFAYARDLKGFDPELWAAAQEAFDALTAGEEGVES